MIDPDAYAASLKLPAGATENSKLQLSVSEIRRLLKTAYLRGARDAIGPLRDADSGMPEFFKGLFGDGEKR